MTFSDALDALKSGALLQRSGWNGKGMWLVLVRSWAVTHQATDPAWNLPHAPFIAMKTADGKVVPWLASQTDLLADDWSVLA